MMWDHADAQANVYTVIVRLMELRDVLRSESLDVVAVIERLPNRYTSDESGKRQVRRDIQNLEVLGYTLQHEGRPARWSIATETHLCSDEDIEALIHIREAFGNLHPLAPAINQLLVKLTSQLSPEQHKRWQRRPALRMPLKPVLDYSDCADLIRWLETAISKSQQIRFEYKSRLREAIILHSRLDPYEIEYTDGHFYLAAFSYQYGSILTFRIDRIVWNLAQGSPMMYPNAQQLRRNRKPIFFTYRLPAAFADGGVSERFKIHGVQQDGGYVIVEASDTNEFHIIRTLLGYGEHALLLAGPPTLLQKMHEAVRLMGENYSLRNAG